MPFGWTLTSARLGILCCERIKLKLPSRWTLTLQEQGRACGWQRMQRAKSTQKATSTWFFLSMICQENKGYHGAGPENEARLWTCLLNSLRVWVSISVVYHHQSRMLQFPIALAFKDTSTMWVQLHLLLNNQSNFSKHSPPNQVSSSHGLWAKCVTT